MPSTHNPRHGSMQFWPRVRASRIYPRMRAWLRKDAGFAGFAGYKVGMTHVSFVDSRKNSHTKGMEVSWPVTIIECPAIKIIGASFYKKDAYGLHCSTKITTKSDKFRERKTSKSKSNEENLAKLNANDYADIRAIVQLQPHMAGIAKKTPEIFEIGLGGSMADRFNVIKEKLGKEVTITEVFKEGELLDVTSITKGKGFQGPIVRFGVKRRHHKSEKSIRNPGSLGAWCGQAHMMYRVAHAGQTGFQQRTELNKLLMKISNDAKEVNPIGGFVKGAPVKSTFILLKGCVGGPKKRMITLSKSRRADPRSTTEQLEVTSISTLSQQR